MQLVARKGSMQVQHPQLVQGIMNVPAKRATQRVSHIDSPTKSRKRSPEVRPLLKQISNSLAALSAYAKQDSIGHHLPFACCRCCTQTTMHHPHPYAQTSTHTSCSGELLLSHATPTLGQSHLLPAAQSFNSTKNQREGRNICYRIYATWRSHVSLCSFPCPPASRASQPGPVVTSQLVVCHTSMGGAAYCLSTMTKSPVGSPLPAIVASRPLTSPATTGGPKKNCKHIG